MEGNRFIGSYIIFFRRYLYAYFCIENFNYQIADKWNLASHLFVKSFTHDSILSTQFLGGFESIRGLPDGYLYGTHAAYANLELRHLSYQGKNIWLQIAFFST